MPKKRVPSRPELFIRGHFSDRVNAGEKPTYGYPASPPIVLPKDTPSMEVKTGFMEARRASKKGS